MAQRDVQSLFLQVDASVELLRKNLLAGEQPLDRFEARSEKMAAKVDQAIGTMGDRFGAFAELADTAAQRAQKSFEASFSQVQKAAAVAIKGPTIEGGANLGAADIRAGAAAAQEKARAFQLIQEAAERAALAERDTSEATHLFIQATNASRIEAERQAAALLAEAGALERVEIELGKSAAATELFVTQHHRLAEAADEEKRLAIAAEDAAASQKLLASQALVLRDAIDPMFAAQRRFDQELTRADTLLDAGAISMHEYELAVRLARNTLQEHAQSVAGSVAPTQELDLVQRRGAVSAGQQRAAMQQLGFQVNDVATSFASGARPMMIFAQQGGQVIQAISLMTNETKGFLGFLGGPWGAVLTAATLVLVPMVGKLLEGNDALDDAVDKLKKDAAQTEATRLAKERFSHTAEGVAAAIRDGTEATRKSIEAEKDAAEQANIAAKVNLAEEIAIRRKTQARLADAKAELEAQIRRATGPGQGSEVAALGLVGKQSAVDKLKEDLAGQDALIAEAQARVNETRIDLAAEAAKRAVDPIARINRLYDDQARAAREAARANGLVTSALTAQLTAIERNRQAALAAEQDRQAAARRSARDAVKPTRQFGRQITVDDARAIVAGIGGRVTSGVRSTAKQAQLYARYQRGVGPLAAKPGTSLHESGQAVDIARGAGITLTKIKAAFEAQGVRLTELLDEGDHYHAGFGKKGKSTAVVAKQAETARLKVLADDYSYTDEERSARRQLLAATKRTATSEQQRANLAAEDIAVEAEAGRKQIANKLAAGKITKAQAEHLTQINDATETQRLQNLIVERATRQIASGYDAEAEGLDAKIALKRIEGDLATTTAERKRIALQLLDLEQEQVRVALKKTRDTSQDPAEVQRAQKALDRLPAAEAGQRDQIDRQYAGPLDQYRARIHASTDDMNEALQGVAVNGLQNLEDGLLGVISGTESVASAFKKLAASIIADLARIAIEKAIVGVIGKSFFGLSEGGAIGDVPGFAEGGTPGGLIKGPGTGTSDSILAILGGGKGAIRVSTDEFIVNAAATKRHLPLLEAINSGKLPGFATGGRISAPRLPDLSSIGGGASAGGQIMLRVSLTDELDARIDNRAAGVAVEVVRGAAPALMDGAKNATITALRRPSL